jgi:hypothetical protein
MAKSHSVWRRRVITVVASAALFVVPFLIAQPGSATITQPVSVTTSIRGGSAAAGVPTIVDFTVTNRSTNGAKLGLFTIVVPGGVSGLTKPTASPTTWATAALPCGSTPRCSSLVLASATRASAFLSSGASMTLTMQFTPTAAGTLSFPLIGIGGGLFFATSTPTITVGGHLGLKITSVTATSVLGKTGLFHIDFQLVDASGNPVTSPNVLVTLTALNGPLGALSALPVLSANGTGELVGVYNGLFSGLQLRLSSPGLDPAATTVDVTAAGITVSASPGEGLTLTAGDINLSFGLAIATLPNGANGPVTLNIGPCVPDAVSDCQVDDHPALTEISLTGDLKGLYGFQTPAEMDWQCNDTNCPPASPDGRTRYDFQQAEFANHPVEVAPSNDGSFGAATAAPPCSGVSTRLSRGQILEPDAQKLGFCVDVGAINRSAAQCDETCSEWDGNLTMPVLFVNDPRFYSG